MRRVEGLSGTFYFYFFLKFIFNEMGQLGLTVRVFEGKRWGYDKRVMECTVGVWRVIQRISC
jgi:hypothetical protein